MQQKNLKNKKYIHIGLPKNLSSTLQEFYFNHHPEILHLGIGVERLIDYIDDDINALFEHYLLYAKDFIYEEKTGYFSDKLNYYFDKAKRENKVTGVSLELLSFTFTPDMIDITTKAKRLKELFGEDTTIILILRNQIDLISSMYREFIKIGYQFSYKEYIDYIYNFQGKSFLSDLFYDKLITLYSKLFSFENIAIIPVEDYRTPSGQLTQTDGSIDLLSKLNKALHINHHTIELGHTNPPLSNKELYQKMMLNKNYHHDLSNSIFEGADNHRLYKYFSSDLKIDFPDPFHDVKQKRRSIDYAKELAKNDTREIDYYADPAILEKLKHLYEKSNQALSKQFNISLPAVYFNL